MPIPDVSVRDCVVAGVPACRELHIGRQGRLPPRLTIGLARVVGLIATPWWFADIYPTFLSIAGARDARAKLDGLDVRPTLRGKSQPSLANRYFYWEDPGKIFSQAVRRGSWKAVRTGKDAPLQLFNLHTDVGETRDVAAAHPEVIAEFNRYLTTARTPSPHWPDER